MDERKMTDKEMLAVAYGALKVNPKTDQELLKMIEDHLFPKKGADNE